MTVTIHGHARAVGDVARYRSARGAFIGANTVEELLPELDDEVAVHDDRRLPRRRSRLPASRRGVSHEMSHDTPQSLS